MRFRLFGFPVQIEASFWIIAILFGLNVAGGSMAAVMLGMAIWLGILLVSLLVHELGHALAARAYGESPHIVLHALGGRTVWSPRAEPTRVQRVVVTAAGPLAGYLLAAVAFVAMMVSGQGPRGEDVGLAGRILGQLTILNVFWSTFNLLPVIPFDGGHILAALLGKGRERLSLIVSGVVGVLGAIGFLLADLMFGAIILGWAAATNWMSLRRPEPAAIPRWRCCKCWTRLGRRWIKASWRRHTPSRGLFSKPRPTRRCGAGQPRSALGLRCSAATPTLPSRCWSARHETSQSTPT